MQFMQLGSKRNRDEFTWDNPSIFPNKDVTVHELNNTAMNEGMLEIKALNWILSLLYMLILVSWKHFHPMELWTRFTWFKFHTLITL